MAIRKDVDYPGRWSAATTEYPMGEPKNRTTSTSKDGSYLEKKWIQDYEAFFGALLSEAGVNPNGSVDTAESSQFFDALQEAINMAITNGTYASIPVGMEIALDTPPPTDDPRFRFVKLTYNDSYNSGALTAQTLSGSAPELVSTAVISDPLSSIDGQTIHLINTMGTFIRPGGNLGDIEASKNRLHYHNFLDSSSAIRLVDTTSTGSIPTTGGDLALTGSTTRVSGDGGEESNPYYITRIFYKRIR